MKLADCEKLNGKWVVYDGQGGVYRAYRCKGGAWRCYRRNKSDKPPHAAEWQTFDTLREVRAALAS
jgi:hypothetical protein